MLNDNIKIGTSGFSYSDWLGNFYPQSFPQADYLKFYAGRFNTVEIDSTFYRIPSEKTVAKWRDTVGPEFRFAAKFPRTVTHEGPLATRIAYGLRFIEVMKSMGEKLGVLLLQFPYSFKPDRQRFLLELIAALPDDIRLAVELRHKGWLEDTLLFDQLSQRNIAYCLIDHPWMPRVRRVTADFHYFRFLGDRKKIEDDFSHVRIDRTNDLEWWKDMILDFSSTGNTVFGFFNNHYSGHSPTTADLMLEILEAAQ